MHDDVETNLSAYDGTAAFDRGGYSERFDSLASTKKRPPDDAPAGYARWKAMLDRATAQGVDKLGQLWTDGPPALKAHAEAQDSQWLGELNRRAHEAQAAPPGLTDTDIANAKRFATRYGEEVRFTPERDWLVWDGRRWAPDDKALKAQELAKKVALSIYDEVRQASDRDEAYTHAKKSQSRRAIEAMLWLARSEDGIPAHLADFDADPWLFNVANGTVDLRTGQLQPHCREDRLTNIAEVDFDPDADCERWDRFLWRVTGENRELYDYLRRYCGYLLVGDVSEHSLCFLYGSGRNGKSVFCDTLQRLMGTYACTASPDMLMLKQHKGIPNDVARLKGVRAAFMNETSEGTRFDEAKLKDLTGGDRQQARFLHKEFFDFDPTHRLLLRGNHKPQIRGTDDGIWSRLHLVPFTVQIPKEEQDKRLLQKLTAELPGILNWCLQGCQEWQRDGLMPPECVTAAVEDYRKGSDILAHFIEVCCEVRRNAQVKSSVVYAAYRQFCERSGERPVASKSFPEELERRGFEKRRAKAGVLFEGLELCHAEAPSWHD
jgi:putative DNA primase/helicase